MLDVDIPTHMLQDPYEIRVPGQGRDPERSPMQWNAEAHAGFSEFEPWLPVGANYQTVNVVTQRKEATSMLNLYRQLLKYREEAPVLTMGSYRSLDGASEDCFVYFREIESQRLAIALNFSAKGRVLRMDDQPSGRLVLSTHLDREERVDLRSLHLRGHEACIVEL
jgi:alpha-glucosidase